MLSDLLNLSSEVTDTIAVKLYSQNRIELVKKDSDGDQELTLFLRDLNCRVLAIITINEIISLSLRDAPLIGELYPEIPRCCIENTFTSTDLVLSTAGSQQNQDEMLQSLVEALQALSSHSKSGLGIAVATLNRIMVWHIEESPFRPVLGLDTALVSCCNAFYQILSRSEIAVSNSSVGIDRVKEEPLATLKVSAHPYHSGAEWTAEK